MNAENGKSPTTINLNVVLHKQGEYWVGHCVQLDILTSGPDQDKVWCDIQALIRAQIAYAVLKDPEFKNLFRPPSPELMRMMSLGRDLGQIVLVIDGRVSPSPAAVVLHKIAA